MVSTSKSMKEQRKEIWKSCLEPEWWGQQQPKQSEKYIITVQEFEPE
jgi:hypothetical protein